MNDLFNIGYSGLRTAQMQLNVASLNAANMATPGFTRQRVEQMAILPAAHGGVLNTGQGVEVKSIRRMADRFLTEQVWQSNTPTQFYNINQGYLSQLETFLGADSSGISEGFKQFFNALSAASGTPENQALRQDALASAGNLAGRFNKLQQVIATQQDNVVRQQQDTVASINNLSDRLALYNRNIVEAVQNGGDTSILRDQRDQLVLELSGYIEIKVQEDDKGYYNVALSQGQPLVNGQNAAALGLEQNSQGEQGLVLDFAGTRQTLDLRQGGSLGALFDYQNGTLNEISATLQGMAKALAGAFNSQLAEGFDLNGKAGKPLFSFDPGRTSGMLQVTDITWQELAFSSATGEQGNNQNLEKLSAIRNKKMDIPGYGETTLDSASTTMVSGIGLKSRENQSHLDASQALLQQAVAAQNSLSAVSNDEEAINLIVYTKAYQSNMKIISTGEKIFTDLLALI